MIIGDHEDKKQQKVYENLLYQIRPAFGGNIIATIINPDCRPQMATVREGVMKKEILDPTYKGKIKNLMFLNIQAMLTLLLKSLSVTLKKAR